MIFKFILVVTPILAVFFGAHLFIYYSVVRFLAIPQGNARTVLFFVLIFLSFSFFVSALLVRLHQNPFTQSFYIFSATWLGILVNVLIALTCVWLIKGLCTLTGIAWGMRTVSILFMTLAVVISVTGIWNARHPRLKRVEVKLPDLPQSWKNKTIVQLSDVHLGAAYGVSFLKRVRNTVHSLKPDLILITGDLFDGMGGDLPSFVGPLNELDASKGVFFITGNHEGYLGLERPLSLLRKTRIRILNDEVVDLDGLQIVGISYPVTDHTASVKKLFSSDSPYDPAKPAILMYHTPTNILQSHENIGKRQLHTYMSPDVSMSFAKSVGIDLQLSGHTHKGQIFPFGFVTRLSFGKYDYGLHQEDGFAIYTTSGTGTWGPPMRTGCQSEIVAITLK